MKAVTMYRPFAIDKALEDFDRYIDSFFGEPSGNTALRSFGRNGAWIPAVDIRESENAWEIDAELPGFDEKDISVQLENGRLSIEAKTDENVKDEGGRYLIRERRRVSCSRTFRLPENADPESVAARYRNGVLSLSVRKRPEAQKKIIRIGVNKE
ncbi:MAG: Hsp20/alpha crystallin family protein [Spirochaetaceae bacterium]|jgi:HSP20 family protein|nr:Hsp20/alpha crystallin family protein [Spirochaetaceae bacterium]